MNRPEARAWASAVDPGLKRHPGLKHLGQQRPRQRRLQRELLTHGPDPIPDTAGIIRCIGKRVDSPYHGAWLGRRSTWWRAERVSGQSVCQCPGFPTLLTRVQVLDWCVSPGR